MATPGTIIDDLAAKGAEKLGEGQWVNSTLKKGRELTAKAPTEIQPLLEAGLKVLADEKEALAEASGSLLVVAVAAVPLGRINEERLRFLREQATADERHAAFRDAQNATIREKNRRVQTWETLERVAGAFFKEAGAVGLSMLLNSVKGEIEA